MRNLRVCYRVALPASCHSCYALADLAVLCPRPGNRRGYCDPASEETVAREDQSLLADAKCAKLFLRRGRVLARQGCCRIRSRPQPHCTGDRQSGARRGLHGTAPVADVSPAVDRDLSEGYAP